jgi:hypothetical protein
MEKVYFRVSALMAHKKTPLRDSSRSGAITLRDHVSLTETRAWSASFTEQALRPSSQQSHL